ncbi:hypothetical protein SAMN04487934_1176 [Eubacterium ruminantium]|nr:hypothetical protein SAMN04487934_1176 [Eubacterium ruminantium]
MSAAIVGGGIVLGINMFKRSVFNVRMLFIVLISLFIFMYEMISGSSLWYWGIKNYDKNIVAHIEDLMRLSVYVPISAIFPGIVYGFSIMEERNSGFLKTELSRINKKSYIRKKIITAGISGMTATLLPYILLVIISYAIGCTAATPTNGGFQIQTWMWTKYMYIWGGFFYILCEGLRFALHGIFWALFSMFVSLVINNRYVAYIIPYIFDQISEILVRQVYVFSKIYQFVPHFLLKASFPDGTWIGKPYLLYILYIAVLAIAIRGVFLYQCRKGKI